MYVSKNHDFLCCPCLRNQNYFILLSVRERRAKKMQNSILTPSSVDITSISILWQKSWQPQWNNHQYHHRRDQNDHFHTDCSWPPSGIYHESGSVDTPTHSWHYYHHHHLAKAALWAAKPIRIMEQGWSPAVTIFTSRLRRSSQIGYCWWNMDTVLGLGRTDLLWSKNVTSQTWGPNWPFRCLDAVMPKFHVSGQQVKYLNARKRDGGPWGREGGAVLPCVGWFFNRSALKLSKKKVIIYPNCSPQYFLYLFEVRQIQSTWWIVIFSWNTNPFFVV